MNQKREAFGRSETPFPDLRREENAVVLCDIEAAGQTRETTFLGFCRDLEFTSLAYILLSVGQGQSMEDFPKEGITIFRDKSLLARQEAIGERGAWKIDYCEFKNGAYDVWLNTARMPKCRSRLS